MIAENGTVVELDPDGARIVDHVQAGVTFVDGLGVGDVEDVALRDRRRLSEDGVLIVVTTVALADGVEIAPPELIARGVGEDEDADRRAPRRGRPDRPRAGQGRGHRDQAPPGAHPRRDRQGGLRAHAAPPDDPAGRDRGVSADGLGGRHRARTQDDASTVRRLVTQLHACEAAAIAFCRLLERWGRGDAKPSTAGARQAAFRHAADRVETALAGLEAPLSAYLVELEPERAEGRSWYGGPGAGELVEWRPVLERAGVAVSQPRRRRLPRAGSDGARASGPRRCRAPRRGARPLVALGRAVRPHDTLFGATVDDLRALAAWLAADAAADRRRRAPSTSISSCDASGFHGRARRSAVATFSQVPAGRGRTRRSPAPASARR